MRRLASWGDIQGEKSSIQGEKNSLFGAMQYSIH
jgi:hypothetical protein